MVWARRRGAVSVRWKLMVLGAETSLSIRLHLSSTGLSPHAASVKRGKYGSVLELIHQRSA